MELSDAKKREYVKRLLFSRMRILMNNGFYGLLLMHMSFALDDSIRTACTDGMKIYFSSSFMDELSDNELDFVMMHEIMHIALKHCFREDRREHELFNIACDIVVNSNILLSEGNKRSAITLKKYGEAMHLTPDGSEGNEFTAEEVYEMLVTAGVSVPKKGGRSGEYVAGKQTWDDHSRWGNAAALTKDEWDKYVRDAAEAISIQHENGGRSTVPLGAARLIKQLKNAQADWRTLLADFVQEEISDYSFTPPDRRYDGDFFLPDFNDASEFVKNVLFMVDTSGSVSDDMLTESYAEIKGAIDQFDGKLKGEVGFFDSVVYPPQPFEDVDDLLSIKPRGGGGTDFDIIFEYIFKHMDAQLPCSIVILTDGYAPIPKQEAARGIPVLWLICDSDVTPPWGKIARIKTE